MRDGSGGKFGFDGETVLCYRNYQLVKGYAFKNGIILLSIELVIKQVFPKGEGQTLVCGDVLRRLPGKRIVYDGLLGERRVQQLPHTIGRRKVAVGHEDEYHLGTMGYRVRARIRGLG